jgi:hypothetical protein
MLPKQVRFLPLGFPVTSWAFAIRIWLGAIVALYVSFWLSLEAPSTALITVAIVAEPTRGQALEKAVFRLIATVIGVAVSIAITELFSQTRDLLLIDYAGWMGLCVYVAGLLVGNRAYAAVLSGFTVALVAIPQIDKASNRRSALFRSNPGPESRTATSAPFDSSFSVQISYSRASSRMLLIASTALIITLRITCCGCTRSAWTVGEGSAKCVSTDMPFFVTSSRISSSASRIAPLISMRSFFGGASLKSPRIR